MKVMKEDYGFVSSLPTNSMQSQIRSSAKLFTILSDGIYRDKLLAVVRETGSNAWDAHYANKCPQKPFTLKLPDRFDLTYRIEDEGTGIAPANYTYGSDGQKNVDIRHLTIQERMNYAMRDIYMTYGASTKEDDAKAIGALGLGCKSPLAYTKGSFLVKNRYASVEYTYMIYIGADGAPALSLMADEPTTRPNGLTVEFACKNDDVYAFANRAKRFYKYWAVKPIIVDSDGSVLNDVLDTQLNKIIDGQGWFLESRQDGADHRGAIAVQGQVPYPIIADSIPNLPGDLRIIAKNPFVITFDMGSVNFTASREDLSYDEATNKNIAERLDEVKQEIGKSFQADVFKKGMTQVEFIINFSVTFRKFTDAFKYREIGAQNETEWFCSMLLGKSPDDTVTYDRRKFKIEDLLKARVFNGVNEHQPFGIYQPATRGLRSTRFFLKPLTQLSYHAKKKLNRKEIFADLDDDEIILGELDPSNVLACPWRALSVPRKMRNEWDCIFRSAGKFNVYTENTFELRSDPRSATFVINDCASIGDARFKELMKNVDTGKTQYFYVTFNHRDTDATKVEPQLRKLLDDGMKGSKIILLSSLPDYRTQTAKAPKDKGVINVYALSIVQNSRKRSMAVSSSPSYGMELSGNEIHLSRPSIEAFQVSDLQSRDEVIFAIKRRTEKLFYDDFEDCKSVIHNEETLFFANCLGLLNNLFVTTKNSPKSIPILLLTEGQYDWLKKKNVNMRTLRDVVAERIKEAKAADDFVAKIERYASLSNISVVKNIFMISDKEIRNRMSAGVEKSMIKKIFAEYMSVSASDVTKEYAKVDIYNSVSSSKLRVGNLSDVSSINKAIEKRYPLLPHIQFVGGPKEVLPKVIDYIEGIDQ